MLGQSVPRRVRAAFAFPRRQSFHPLPTDWRDHKRAGFFMPRDSVLGSSGRSATAPASTATIALAATEVFVPVNPARKPQFEAMRAV